MWAKIAIFGQNGDFWTIFGPKRGSKIEFFEKFIIYLLKRIFDYLEDYKILSQNVRAFGENIPPLINAYMNLSPTMRTFGTVHNTGFGNVEETGIMITIKDMYLEKINRHLASYREDYKIGIGY